MIRMPDSIETRLALLQQKVESIDVNMVTKDEFKPVARVVYGIVTLVGASFLTAVAALVFQAS